MIDITGQVFLREGGRHANGRRLVMVVGIIGVPDDFPLKGEHQYVVAGDTGLLMIAIHRDKVIDLTERVRGWSAGSLLTEPLWRIGEVIR